MTPTKEGFWWAKWKIKSPGTAEEDEPPGDEWEVMHVVENCIDHNDPEYLLVMVPGVAVWQSLANFYWGKEVINPMEATPEEQKIMREYFRTWKPPT